MKKKNFVRNWIILLVIIVGIYLGWRTYYSSQLSPVDSNDTQVRLFVIPKGESTASIVERLKKEGLIKSPTFFKLMIKNSGSSGSIQAGDFKLSPSMSSPEILKALSEGAIDKWVTLLEGWRMEEVARELNQELGVKNSEFLVAAKKYEGHLFPDTYLLNPDTSVEDLVSLLTNTFDKRYSPELRAKVKKLGLTEEQGVVLASIVEREARSDEVRTKVASILLKRLKIGMGLNADATVRYAKDSADMKTNPGTYKYWQAITQADYKGVESPYNTYLHAGLPPAPICNPSLSSLTAVANADPSTPYLYYYHDSKGNSYYAKTLEEHNENVANHR